LTATVFQSINLIHFDSKLIIGCFIVKDMKMPTTSKPFGELLELAAAKNRLGEVLTLAANVQPRKQEYLHWDELRHRTPPDGLSLEEWWLAIKLRRRLGMRRLPLKDKRGSSFEFSVPDPVLEQLHHIDCNAGASVGGLEPVTNPQTRDRYLIRSLTEEAITSSQLEGAVTTREVAKQMLSTGRKPRDKSEQMILNNYRTMQRIQKLRESALTPELVIDLQRMIGEHALDKPDAAGRLRRADEPIDISDLEGTVFHVPPSAEELPTRLEMMCRFANGKIPDYFIHPVVRAIILHFWLAYDHPFVDGNGRTARALFYWAMLKHEFWLFEFISISQIIRRAPVQYGMAFLHAETDENDLTYFIIHQIEVVRRAIKELRDYIGRKTNEVEKFKDFVRNIEWLNHRQQAILIHALKHPGQLYTVAGHRGWHRVAYATGLSDLRDLAERCLLEQRKSGKEFVFQAPSDIAQRLKSQKASFEEYK
jgi:Fic family protein